MKKLLYIAVIFSLSVNVYAQEETTDVLATEEETVNAAPNLSKNGKQITPIAGDIGVGFSASNIIGSILADNGVGNSATSPFGAQVVFGRYFLDANTVLRARITVDHYIDRDKSIVVLDNQNDANVFTENPDERIQAQSNLGLGVGLEKRRGNGRLQGYYGAELFMSRSNFSTIYNYGNEMSVDNQNPITTNFDGNATGNDNFTANDGVNSSDPEYINNQLYYKSQERRTANYGGTALNFTLNAILGVEYFVAPKISIGGEIMIGGYYSTNKGGREIWEKYSDDGLEEEIREYDSGKRFGSSSDASSAIFANFYF